MTLVPSVRPQQRVSTGLADNPVRAISFSLAGVSVLEEDDWFVVEDDQALLKVLGHGHVSMATSLAEVVSTLPKMTISVSRDGAGAAHSDSVLTDVYVTMDTTKQIAIEEELIHHINHSTGKRGLRTDKEYDLAADKEKLFGVKWIQFIDSGGQLQYHDILHCSFRTLVVLSKVTELVEYHHKLRDSPEEGVAAESDLVTFRDHGLLSVKLLGKFPKHYKEGLFTPQDLFRLQLSVGAIAGIKDYVYLMPALLRHLDSEQVSKYVEQATSLIIRPTQGCIARGCTSLMDKQCTNLHMAKIAAFLPKWKVVTKLLGLEEQIIRDIENRYPNGEDQRLEALMKWVGLKGPQATYRNIYDTLGDLEEMEAAAKVKKLATDSNSVLFYSFVQ
eukprot:Em0004g1661a